MYVLLYIILSYTTYYYYVIWRLHWPIAPSCQASTPPCCAPGFRWSALGWGVPWPFPPLVSVGLFPLGPLLGGALGAALRPGGGAPNSGPEAVQLCGVRLLHGATPESTHHAVGPTTKGGCHPPPLPGKPWSPPARPRWRSRYGRRRSPAASRGPPRRSTHRTCGRRGWCCAPAGGWPPRQRPRCGRAPAAFWRRQSAPRKENPPLRCCEMVG